MSEEECHMESLKLLQTIPFRKTCFELLNDMIKCSEELKMAGSISLRNDRATQGPRTERI